MLYPGPCQGRRALSLVPINHLVVVASDQVVATVRTPSCASMLPGADLDQRTERDERH